MYILTKHLGQGFNWPVTQSLREEDFRLSQHAQVKFHTRPGTLTVFTFLYLSVETFFYLRILIFTVRDDVKKLIFFFNPKSEQNVDKDLFGDVLTWWMVCCHSNVR